ncbi:MAG TPA: methionine--tRNA ligase [Acidimicrobiales bacterium]|nr:methionine--tRNA ligase [Acidimicrobiales bacterium]
MPDSFFQTTPIYYVNDRPHLGTAYSTVTADAFARWHRSIGDDVFFLTGTDEHGLKIVRVAEERGKSTNAWVDEASAWFGEAWNALEITNDDFIRTTEERHVYAVQKFMQAIYDNGYIYLGEYAGWYCVSCEAYYSDAELLDGQRCPVHEREVEWLVEENYFFALSRFADQLLEWYRANPGVVFPETRKNEALGIIKQGLEDISVTRTSFDWGIPVPWDERHVVYVWYDALINYVTAAGYGVDDERFARLWPAVHHLVGKDILRFHAVWWPAMCMAAGITPPAQIVAHGWLMVGGEKMSKSRTNQLDPVEIAADVGVETLRYHLLRDVALGNDGDFTYEGLLARHNTDLANNLGNLLQRVSTVVGSKCNGVGPIPRAASETPLSSVADETIRRVREAWTRFAPHDALELTWRLVHEANAALEKAEPWKMEPGPAVDAVLGDALEVLRIVSILASPALPETCAEIFARIGLEGRPDDPGRARSDDGELIWGLYQASGPVIKGPPLFPRRRLDERED